MLGEFEVKGDTHEFSGQILMTIIGTSFIHMESLVLLGLATLLLVVGVRLVPLGFTRLITLITLVTLVTLVTLPLIIFLQILGLVALCCANN